MSNRHTNFSGIFQIFEHDKPDKTGTILKKLGEICFTICFVAYIPVILINNDYSPISSALMWIVAPTFLGGFIFFIATGIHYMRREKGFSKFLASKNYVLKYTFLLLFFPAIIIVLIALIFLLINTLVA
jgi:hypothetical protein